MVAACHIDNFNWDCKPRWEPVYGVDDRLNLRALAGLRYRTVRKLSETAKKLEFLMLPAC